GLDIPVAGDHNDRRIVPLFAEILKRFEAINAVAKPDVEQDARKPFSAARLETLFPRLGGKDHETLILEHRSQRVADTLFVVDDDNGVGHLSAFKKRAIRR